MVRAIRRLFRYSQILKVSYVRRDSVFDGLEDRIEAADYITGFFVLFSLCLFIPLVAPFLVGFLEEGLGGILDIVNNFPLLVFIIFLLLFFVAGATELVDNLQRGTELKRKQRFYQKLQNGINRS